MKTYLVGGAVRDIFMGKQPHDFDYVVTGTNIEEMLQQGFIQVGKEFPVFLHPQTHCEYALARKEIKTGPLHTDFKFIFEPSITLAEDLERRDFTCNALAKDCQSGEITDLHNGILDIRHRVLRHVNADHFPEDPLRVLRLCRFAAQLNFTVAPETMKLAQNMVQAGILAHLTPERIWGELHKAMSYPGFSNFLTVARQCGALSAILPAVDRLWNVPEPPQYHPEGNSGAHTLLCLNAAAQEPPLIKFAVMLHDIGKTITPSHELPHHYRHEKNGLAIIDTICHSLKAPTEYRHFAKIVCALHMKFHNIQEMRLSSLIRLIDAITAKHHPEYLPAYIAACRADMSGRQDNPLREQDKTDFDTNAELLQKIHGILQSIRAADMPGFETLPKDKTFRERYQNFRFHQTQKLLSEIYGIKKK